MTIKLKLINITNSLFIILLFSSCSDLSGLVELAVKENMNNEEKLSVNELNKVSPSIKSDLFKDDFRTSEEIDATISTSYMTSKPKPVYKIGEPYEINNIWYYPKRDLTYEETGIASWYGDKFHGRITANGEIFNKNIISAAHKTLPMPSMVRVTNLDNGNVLNVRINDRGPYVHGRIIDLSEKAAELLGFKEVGVSRVKVNILLEQSLWLERSAKEGKFPGIYTPKNNPIVLPSINSASRPKVSIKNTSEGVKDLDETKINIQKSFTEILASSRQGNLRNVNPTETKIWVQVGAFSSTINANNVVAKVAHLSKTKITTIDSNGRILHRVRLGPTQEIEMADEILNKVFELGYKGSKIVVD